MLALRPARRTSWMNRASGNLDVPRPRSVGALDLELVLANALETGGAECTAIRQPAHPAVPAYRVELVFVGSDRGEDPPTPELPLLDLVVVALDVVAKCLEIRPQALLHDAEPRLSPVVVDVDAALLEQVVLDLLEDECVDVTQRLRPVRLFSGVECDQFDIE